MSIRTYRHGKPWTEDDKALLARRLTEGVRLTDISAELGRSRDAVRMQRNQLGFRFRQHYRPWSPSDVQRLFKALEKGARVDEIAAEMNRSTHAIKVRLYVLGLRANRTEGPRRTRSWRQSEDALLCELWPKATIDDIAKELGRAPSSVFTRAGVLGLPRRRSPKENDRNTWLRERGYFQRRLSGGELRIVEQRLNDGCSVKCVAERIGVSKNTIERYIDLHALDDLPGEFDAVIAELAATGMPVVTIGRKLELNLRAVRMALRREAVAPHRVVHKRREKQDWPKAANRSGHWTSAEVALLRELRESGATTAFIAGQLGRGKNAVVGKVHRLGIGSGRSRASAMPWPSRSSKALSDDERETIDQRILDGCSVACIAGRLRRLQRTVRSYVESSGLRELSDEIIPKIHRLANDGFTSRMIAFKLGVSARAIGALLNNGGSEHA